MSVYKQIDFQIRPFEKVDQKEVDDLLIEINSEFKESIFSDKIKSNNTPIDSSWVLSNGESIIGTVAIILLKNKKAILKRMMLKKTFRGSKYALAPKLLNTAVDFCKYKNVKTLFLGTMTQFKAAHDFYEKNNFRPIKKSDLPSDFKHNPIDSKFYQRYL